MTDGLHPIMEQCLAELPRLSEYSMKADKRKALTNFTKLLKDTLAREKLLGNKALIRQLGRAINKSEQVLSNLRGLGDPVCDRNDFINFVKADQVSPDSMVEIRSLFTQIQTVLEEHPSKVASSILADLGRLVEIEVAFPLVSHDNSHKQSPIMQVSKFQSDKPVPREHSPLQRLPIIQNIAYPVHPPPEHVKEEGMPSLDAIADFSGRLPIIPANPVVGTLNTFDWRRVAVPESSKNNFASVLAELNENLLGVGVRLQPTRLYLSPLAIGHSRKTLRIVSETQVDIPLLQQALPAAFNFQQKGKWITFSWYSEGIHQLEITQADQDGVNITKFFTQKANELSVLVPMTCCLSHLLREVKMPDVVIAALALYSLKNESATMGQAVFDCVMEYANCSWVSKQDVIHELMLCVSPQQSVNFVIKHWNCKIITRVNAEDLGRAFKDALGKLSSISKTQEALNIQ